MIKKEFIEILRELYPFFEILLLMTGVFYAGHLHGWRTRADEVGQLANDWVVDNCENLSTACMLSKNSMYNFNVTVPDDRIQINPDFQGIG